MPNTAVRGAILGLPSRRPPTQVLNPYFMIPVTAAVFVTGAEVFQFDTMALQGQKQLQTINFIWIDLAGMSASGTIQFQFGLFTFNLATGSQGYYTIVTQMPFEFVLSSPSLSTGVANIVLLFVNPDTISGLSNQIVISSGGAGGGAGAITYDAALTGTQNGVNTIFTLPTIPAIPASLALFKNGVRLKQGVGYTLAGNTITFLSGYIPNSGDVLEAAMYQ